MLSLRKRSPSNSLSSVRINLGNSRSQRYQNFFKPKCALNLNLITKPILQETLKPMLSLSTKSIHLRKSLNKRVSHKPSMKSLQIQSIPSNIPEFVYENLNDYEKSEIIEYKEIFFAGTKDNKLIPNTDSKNMGYDGENGNYRMIKGDHLAYRYEIVSLIGQGTFGVVCECFDHKYKTGVAVKIIRNKKAFNKQALTEIKILKAIRDSDENGEKPLIRLQDDFVFRNHVFLVFDLLSVSLYEFEKMNRVQGLKEKQIRSFIKQVLEGLCHLKSLSIIHCDLKPENILITSSTCKKIKIIDFGSSCFVHERIHNYIQSRYYRSPEVILGHPYTEAIDMWSLGCMVAELLTGKVLFRGNNEVELLMLIIELLGYPPENLLKQSQKTKLFFSKEGTLRLNTFTDERPLVAKSKQFEWQKTPAGNFIQQCLAWDPELRLTPSKALEHPWLLGAKRSLKKLVHKKIIFKQT